MERQNNFFGTFFNAEIGQHYNGSVLRRGDYYVIIVNLKKVNNCQYLISGYDREDGVHIPAIQTFRHSDGAHDGFDTYSPSFMRFTVEAAKRFGQFLKIEEVDIEAKDGNRNTKYGFYIKSNLDQLKLFLSYSIPEMHETEQKDEKGNVIKQFNVRIIKNNGRYREGEWIEDTKYGCKVVTKEYLIAYSQTSGKDLNNDADAVETMKQGIMDSDTILEESNPYKPVQSLNSINILY